MSKEATIVGSFIYIVLMNLDAADMNKGSVIKLRQRILSRLKLAPKKYAREADELWEKIVKNNPDKFSMYISPFVETLFFNHEDVMLEMFGSDFGTIISRATMKMAYGNDETALKYSYLMADIISKEVLDADK